MDGAAVDSSVMSTSDCADVKLFSIPSGSIDVQAAVVQPVRWKDHEVRLRREESGVPYLPSQQ